MLLMAELLIVVTVINIINVGTAAATSRRHLRRPQLPKSVITRHWPIILSHCRSSYRSIIYAEYYTHTPLVYVTVGADYHCRH